MNKVFERFKKYQETEERYTDVSILNMQNRVCDLLESTQTKKVKFAENIGMTKQQLNSFFNKGHNATLKTIGKIAHGLNKKVVISFVDKDVNNKDFYNYVQSYKSNLKIHKLELIFDSVLEKIETYDSLRAGKIDDCFNEKSYKKFNHKNNLTYTIESQAS